MKPSHKLWLIHALNHLAFFYFIFNADPSYLILSYALWSVIGLFGVSCGFHRLLAHKSFECPAWFEKTCAWLGSMAGFGSPIGWIGAHRMHHSFSDQQGDPHSPKIIGFARSYQGTFDLDRCSMKNGNGNREIS